MQINIWFYSMCSNVMIWPNVTLCAIYFKKCIENENFRSTKISHCVAER
jgi:hypothetical protein